MKPKVSVIIPVYNAKIFIKQCIDNVLEQTLKDIEIIIIDDKSTDDTVDIVKAIIEELKINDNSSKIKLIELEENHRQGYARNIGIEQAQADYIMFLDVDDWYEPDCIEEMYNKIIADDADMTVCKFYTFDDKTLLCDSIHEFKNYTDIDTSLYKGFCYKDIEPMEIFNKCNVVWDKIYKKSFIQENDIKFPGGMFCEDDVFSFKAFFKAKKITVLNKYMLYYRINRKDSSSMLGDKTTFDCFRMFELIKKDLLDLKIYFKMQEAFIGYHVSVCLFFYHLVNNNLKKEFFDRMKSELDVYQGYLENKYNAIKDHILYYRLSYILNNNFYMYELKKFFNKNNKKAVYF